MGNCVWGKDAVVIIKNVKCLQVSNIIVNFAVNNNLKYVI